MSATVGTEAPLSDHPAGRGAGNVLGMDTKQCTRCRETKPVDAFEAFRKGGNTYRRGACRACLAADSAASTARARQRERATDPEAFRAGKAADTTARRKRLRLEQLADVVRLVSAQLADGRSVEAIAEALLAADVRVYGDVS